jgi:hypothetical protein
LWLPFPRPPTHPVAEVSGRTSSCRPRVHFSDPDFPSALISDIESLLAQYHGFHPKVSKPRAGCLDPCGCLGRALCRLVGLTSPLSRSSNNPLSAGRAHSTLRCVDEAVRGRCTAADRVQGRHRRVGLCEHWTGRAHLQSMALNFAVKSTAAKIRASYLPVPAHPHSHALVGRADAPPFTLRQCTAVWRLRGC